MKEIGWEALRCCFPGCAALVNSVDSVESLLQAIRFHSIHDEDSFVDEIDVSSIHQWNSEIFTPVGMLSVIFHQ